MLRKTALLGLLLILTFQMSLPLVHAYLLLVPSSASNTCDAFTINISVTVEVRCKFEIHDGKVQVNLTMLPDQLKRLVTVEVGSAELPLVMKPDDNVNVTLSVQVSDVATAKFDLPISLDFRIPNTVGGYHFHSVSQNAFIEVPAEKKIVDVLFQLDETNCVEKLEWHNPFNITPPKEEPVSYVPFAVENVLEVTGPTAERVDILVASSIWSAVQASVNQYATDLSSSYSVQVYNVTYGTPEQVRLFLQQDLTLNLKGCLLVGDIPYATYFIPQHDDWANETFPCDLFYMDLNGVWTDANMDGKYESHTGDIEPEIWVGRIKPTGMGDQSTLVNNYFSKNHAFRDGTLSTPKRALVYVDDDWTDMADGVDSAMKNIYTDTTKVKDPVTTNASDYKSRLELGYEWVHLQCHGWSGGHIFKVDSNWETVYSSDYVDLDPQVLFYQFFVCSGARFSYDNYLAGASVFRTSYGLLAIGSTKTGSMLYFEDFYSLVSTSKDIGTAFRSWFAAHGEESQDWFYGLTIIGDPALTPTAGYTQQLASLVVRGYDNRVWYRTYSGSWGSWYPIAAATGDSLGAAMLGNNLHIVARDLTGTTIWHSYVNLATNAFSGWTLISGHPVSAPTLTSNGTALSLVVRGGDNRVWYRTYSGGVWGSWYPIAAATGDSLGAAMLGNNLHIVARDLSGTQIWHGYVNVVTNAFSGWTLISGHPVSAPTLTSNGTALSLVVRGGDNKVWYRTYSGGVWGSWYPIAAATGDSLGAAMLGNNLHIVARDMSGTTIWHGYVNLDTNAFSGWTLISGHPVSKPTLTS